MTKENIDKMINRADKLSKVQKIKLANAILNNPETRQLTIAGAWVSGNMDLAVTLMAKGKLRFT